MSPARALDRSTPRLESRYSSRPGVRSTNASEEGTFTLRASPGASVYLNDEWRGRCDDLGVLRLDRLPPGSYRLRVRKVGFLEVRRIIVFPRSRGLTVAVAPRPDRSHRLLRYQQAEDLREERRCEQAIEAYTAALSGSGSKLSPALVGRARCYAAIGKLEEAFLDARGAARNPGEVRAEAQTVLANVLRSQGQYQEAATAYRTALRSAGNFSPEAHAGLAITLDELDEPENALVHLRMALKQDGDAQPVLYYLLGNVSMKLERNREAIRAFEDYLKRAPDSELAPAVESLLENLRQTPQP